jgi:hypothetical protein
MWALTGGIIGLFVAAGIYLSRGSKPPGGASPPNSAGSVSWLGTGLLWALAVGCFLGVWGAEANPGPGGETGGLIVGFMGLVMGAGGLLALNFRRRRKPAAAFVNPAFTRLAGTASRFSGGADPVSRIDTLDRLRSQGTLTDAEFETLKSRIIGGDEA